MAFAWDSGWESWPGADTLWAITSRARSRTTDQRCGMTIVHVPGVSNLTLMESTG